MIRYTITSGEPSPEELLAIEDALKRHVKPKATKVSHRSTWGMPQLREPLQRKP